MSEVIIKLTSDHIKIKGAEYVRDLVRCQDCRWHRGSLCVRIPGLKIAMLDDDYCSHGEVRDE